MREILALHAGGLTALKWNTKLIYSVFLLFCAANWVVMSALAISRSGFALDGIVTYYRGDEAQVVFGKTTGELLEVTHFHLFAMPMILFVQGHLFLLTRWPQRIKILVVLAAALGMALDLAAPWLIVGVSPDLAVLKNLARGLMAVAFVAFAAVPLWEMWIRKPLSAEQLLATLQRESGSPD